MIWRRSTALGGFLPRLAEVFAVLPSGVVSTTRSDAAS